MSFSILPAPSSGFSLVSKKNTDDYSRALEGLRNLRLQSQLHHSRQQAAVSLDSKVTQRADAAAAAYFKKAPKEDYQPLRKKRAFLGQDSKPSPHFAKNAQSSKEKKQ